MMLTHKFMCYYSLMIYREFKRQLGKAGITGREFSQLVKLHPNSLSNYAKGGVVPDHWAIVAALIGEMAEHGLDYTSVIEKVGCRPNKVRGKVGSERFGSSL
ncbi:hypothetical protein DEU29_11546 [Idiomarina aquatica]|uniref:Uncharacterized protein n=1 Tax=Idiomarina aquatica TaxID=1327752 RepID=A0A4R6P1D5_9GAMM|nr:hypothetical protein DEU29_11546 [Idiomarina aquatica]